MYLKALEIQGFKSFPDKTRLTFEKDITAIVGPNGSGKSNISDAILWVMGEQRTRALRGGKMEDVIFGGTEKRPKMGFAQVTLILDNSARTFDTDASELMLTRRYYRSGESEYYINRESVRLKDVSELLMDTGLGRDGYSIIGQGKIAEVVSAKSTDRRELFEEAAGISRYRYRKEESERKLQRTDENLVRISDKIDELKMQLDPLQEQAEVAKKYLVLRDELRLLEVSVWMETLDRLAERAKTVETDWQSAKAALDKAQGELDALYRASEGCSERMREKDVEAETLRERMSLCDAAASDCESSIAVLKNSLEHNSERRAQLEDELSQQGERAGALQSQIAERRARVDEIAKELAQLEQQVKKLTQALGEHSERDETDRGKTARLVSERSEKNAALAHCSTVLSMLRDAQEEQNASERRRMESAAEAQNRSAGLKASIASCEKAYNEAKEKADSLKNIIDGYTMRISGCETKVKALEEKKTKLTVARDTALSRANMLSEMQKEFEGFSLAVKTVMREAGRGVLRGVCGPVANLVKTDERYALALETALGGAMQNIVVETQENGKAAIEFLKRREAGRATFLPVSVIRGYALREDPKGEEGYLGTALELARFDSKYEGIFANLLGRTVVCETLSDAVAMSKRHRNQLRIVTLDGQLINAGGSMTGGSATKNAGILSRANELKAQQARAEELSKQLNACTDALNEAARELSEAKYQLQTADFEQKEALEELRKRENELSQSRFLLGEAEKTIASFETDKALAARRRAENEKRAEETKAEAARLTDEIASLDREVSALAQKSEQNAAEAKALSEKLVAFSDRRAALTSESETTEKAIAQLESLLKDLSGDDSSRREALAALEGERMNLTARQSEAEEKLAKTRENATALRQKLSKLSAEKLELEGRRTQTDKSAQDKNRELLEANSLCASIEQKKLAAEMEEKQLVDKLWDGYELSRTAAQSIREPVENMSEATKRMGTLKRDIARLGTPNLGAIDEYGRVRERYEFLTEQRDDVEKSKRELEKIIDEITKEMKEIFLHEFKAIDESFRKTFLDLFGGGRAALILENEEDVLNCGIEIKVQPPGKTLSTLSLLSGGEKAFVAIALYFAIIKVRPTPFCVMDEIEAALDEANVERFAHYMRTLTNTTQFIVITHRRGTMEEADILYGVTMQEKGVSQVLSVDLDEAEKHISK